MYFSRVRVPTAEGSEERILASGSLSGPWYDVRSSERRRLESEGASAAAAARIAVSIAPSSMSMAIAGGPTFLTAARNAIDNGVEEHDAADPVINALDPSGYRDYMIFEEHFAGWYRANEVPVPAVLYELPVAYLGNPASFVGPGETIRWPAYTRRMDYELELGIVVGRSGSDLSPAEAKERIFGFTILNDFSARDIQFREMDGKLGPCKGKHFACAAGPVIATADEVDWRGGLKMTVRVDGETWAEADSSEAIWGLDELVAWASQGERIEPGWLLGSGTCNGGSSIEIGRELSPGSEIELEIESLGTLRNRLGHPAETGWMPTPRDLPADAA